MIFNTTDGQSLHTIVPGNAANIGPETRLEPLRDKEATPFRAEDTVEQTACKGMAQDQSSLCATPMDTTSVLRSTQFNMGFPVP